MDIINPLRTYKLCVCFVALFASLYFAYGLLTNGVRALAPGFTTWQPALISSRENNRPAPRPAQNETTDSRAKNDQNAKQPQIPPSNVNKNRREQLQRAQIIQMRNLQQESRRGWVGVVNNLLGLLVFGSVFFCYRRCLKKHCGMGEGN